MSKKIKFSRKRMYSDTTWLPFVKSETTQKQLNDLVEKNGYESYYVLENYKVNEARFTNFFIDDKIYKFIDKNYKNINIVIPILHNSPIKTYVQSEKDLENNKMSTIDNNNQDKKIFPIIIMFKDKKDAAKFKLLIV